MKHRSYVASAIVFTVVLFAMYQGYEAIKPDFAVIGWVMFGSAAVFIPGLFGVVLYGIWYFERKLAERHEVTSPKPRARVRKLFCLNL